MPRDRSPKRDKAFEIWKASCGEKTPEIADIWGVSVTRIRKWKSLDNWAGRIKGSVTNKKAGQREMKKYMAQDFVRKLYNSKG